LGGLGRKKKQPAAASLESPPGRRSEHTTVGLGKRNWYEKKKGPQLQRKFRTPKRGRARERIAGAPRKGENAWATETNGCQWVQTPKNETWGSSTLAGGDSPKLDALTGPKVENTTVAIIGLDKKSSDWERGNIRGSRHTRRTKKKTKGGEK